jgi:hypothetical protein
MISFRGLQLGNRFGEIADIQVEQAQQIVSEWPLRIKFRHLLSIHDAITGIQRVEHGVS